MNIPIAIIGIIILAVFAIVVFNFYTYGSAFGNDDKNYTIYIGAESNVFPGAELYIDGKKVDTLGEGTFSVNVTGRAHELKAVKDGKELKRNIYPGFMWIVDFERNGIRSD